MSAKHGDHDRHRRRGDHGAEPLQPGINAPQIASCTRNVKLRDVAGSIVTSVAQDPEVFTHFD